MSYDKLIEYVFYGLLSYASIDLTLSVRRAKDSIDALNIKMARILEKISGHDRVIEDHSGRIKVLETKTKK